MLCGSITVPDLPFEWFNRVIYLYETMGRGGGKVVSALTFLSNNLSSSPTKVFNKIRTKIELGPGPVPGLIKADNQTWK